MKRFLTTSILATILAVGTALMAQDYPDEYLGLPGDNLNLYAVMNLFQKSETIEGFEKSLNDENTRINNLDLNNDNYIDYIKVTDYVDGNVHTIVLQDILDRNESQDVAVFTVEKLRNGSVQIQLIGDEALYGKNYIVEPIYGETPNPGYTGRANRKNSNVVTNTYIQVDTWPLVRYIYLPNYSIWHSSWYWGYYPEYWHPWRPYYWHYYYGYHYNWFPEYYSHFHRYDHPRYAHWNDFYYSNKRVYSRNVALNVNEGRYKNTYSRPEQRQEGEALYAKVHPERASSMSTGNDSRRQASDAVSNRRSENANTRRSTSGTVGNTRANSSQGQNNSGNARRSSGENNGAVNRSTTTVNNRANTNSSAGQSTVTNRRSSSETVNSGSATGSRASQKAEPARTTRKQSTGESSSTRRSTEKARKETVIRQSSSTKKEIESGSTRRK